MNLMVKWCLGDGACRKSLGKDQTIMVHRDPPFWRVLWGPFCVPNDEATTKQQLSRDLIYRERLRGEASVEPAKFLQKFL